MNRLLTQDQEEALASLKDNNEDGLAALLVIMDALVKDQELQVVKFVLNTTNATELTYHKCRAEGARKLYHTTLAFIQASLK